MIFFDLDGVLRDLCTAANIQPTEWNCSIKGLPFIEFFDVNPQLLLDAPVTNYFEIAYFIHEYITSITILSTQKESWRESAKAWINYRFNTAPKVIFTENKLPFLRYGDILVEDSPNLTNYSRVLLIDATYNKETSLPHKRITSPKQLFAELSRYL